MLLVLSSLVKTGALGLDILAGICVTYSTLGTYWVVVQLLKNTKLLIDKINTFTICGI